MKKSQGLWNILPDSDLFMKIERLVVVSYDRTSPLSSVNEAREELFCRKNRSVVRIAMSDRKCAWAGSST